MANVRFDHVTKRFGKVVAVDDFTLEIPDRDFVALVGPSGSGKSTALRLLAGLDTITSGDIYIGDRLINRIAPRDRDIAMVFQSYALYPHMSVHDNMAFGLSLRHVPRDEIRRRVLEAAQILGIDQLLPRKPRELSGGQRQRVALGRAIVREPAVFLLDEPLSNLDAKLRVQTRAEISKLHQRLGTTFVYVTHDQIEAMTMATRIVVMNEGRIQQVGTPQELYERPTNLFVAGFIGSPAMNLFEGEIAATADTASINASTFHLELPLDQARRLRDHGGEKLVFGIRPEDIYDLAFLPPGIEAQSMQARVDVVEPLGNETLLYLLIGEQQFLARVDARTRATPGAQMNVALNLSRLNAFDPQSEQAIALEPVTT